jgi:hypothetical protein
MVDSVFSKLHQSLTSSRVPTNCRFEIDDVEEQWTYRYQFDFIHSRDFLFSIKDWPKLARQCFE